MSLVVLGKRDPQLQPYQTKNRYIPLAIENKEVCSCGSVLDVVVSLRCSFCRDDLHHLIESCIQAKEISNDLKQILQPSRGTTLQTQR